VKIVSVVGVRPQMIKLFPVSRALRARHTEVIVHSGQHYDFLMSDVFVSQMGIPRPDYNLAVGSGSHAEQTAKMLVGLERILAQEVPDVVLVFGDTNSTLAAALAASKVNIPIAHVEAGLRSFNRAMPEEINRVVTDHVSDLLLCPTETAVRNLSREGIVNGVSMVGDVMLDAALHFSAAASLHSERLAPLRLEPLQYLLATIHRASSTDTPGVLAGFLDTFAAIDETIVLPLHPRTRRAVTDAGLTASKNVVVMDPVGYLDMLALEKNARMVLTDSGGVQKEAFFFGVPCLTLRTETEWSELVEVGWNRVVGQDRDAILAAARDWVPTGPRPEVFGTGQAAHRIVEVLDGSPFHTPRSGRT
jgi:UDP-N-acetylglucosamine 2-epimerase